MRKVSLRRSALAMVAAAASAALVLSGCSGSGDSDGKSDSDKKEHLSIGINQLVQHPALDATAKGFKKAFTDAGYVEGDTVEFDEQNANNEQGTALSIAQKFDASNKDLVFAIATPAAQASAQAITDTPVLFSAVTDPVEAELVESNKKPGGNVTGTSDMASIPDQLKLLKKIVPDAKSVGIVYSSGEVNSEVQVKAAKKAAKSQNLTIKTKTVTTANDIQQSVSALGDVDAIYVPTDNMVVSGISSLVGAAEEKKIPVLGAEAGTVEGGAVATLGIDYAKLGEQTGKMALRILEDDQDPAETPVEFAKDFTYVVNPQAAKRQGVKIPDDIMDQAEKVK
jgi:putative ABC transport system substrate-binding protein